MKARKSRPSKRSRPLSIARPKRASLKQSPTTCMPNMPVLCWALWMTWNFIFPPKRTSSTCVPPRAWGTAIWGLIANASKRFVHDSSNQREEVSDSAIDLTEDLRPWWKRSPPLAASAALAIGLATLWFANMLGRVPLDRHSTLGYLLMLPLLLIVPAFSAAGIRLALVAWHGRPLRSLYSVLALAAMAPNLVALAGFARALLRIFSR